MHNAAHPDYAGSALILLGLGVLLLGGPDAPPDGARVLVAWLALYGASAVAEEGLAEGGPPQPPLAPGQNPFWDYMTRPEVRGRMRAFRTGTSDAPGPLQNTVERVRLLLMAPIGFLRHCIFWGSLFTYGACSCCAQWRHSAWLILLLHACRCAGLFVNALEGFVTKGDDRRRYELLAPITRHSASIVLWLCGFNVRLTYASSIVTALTRRMQPRRSALRAARTWWLRSAPLQPPTAHSASCVPTARARAARAAASRVALRRS